MESGVKHSLTNQGSVLTLHSVTRAASGEYLCRASNGVGPDATDKVQKILYSRFTKERNDLKYTTLGREPVSSIHYTRPGSSIKRPTQNSEATIRHVNWPVLTLTVAPKSPSPSIMDP